MQLLCTPVERNVGRRAIYGGTVTLLLLSFSASLIRRYLISIVTMYNLNYNVAAIAFGRKSNLAKRFRGLLSHDPGIPLDFS